MYVNLNKEEEQKKKKKKKNAATRVFTFLLNLFKNE